MSSPYQGSDGKQPAASEASPNSPGNNRNVVRHVKPPDSPEEDEVMSSKSEIKIFSQPPDDIDVDDDKTEEDHENSSHPDTTSTEEGEVNEKEEMIKNPTTETKAKGNRESSPVDKKSGTGEEEAAEDEKEDDTEDDDDEHRSHDKMDDDMELEESGGDLVHGEEVHKTDAELLIDHQKIVDSDHKKTDGSDDVPIKEIQTTVSTPVVTAIRESFLSDSLTEEERRTRTRYIPAVEGMNALRKNEVKSDLLLARTLPGTVSSSKTSKNKQNQRDSPSDDVVMDDVDNDESEQAVSKETNKNPSLDDEVRKMIDLGHHIELVVPSAVFRPPPESSEADNDVKAGQVGTKRPAPFQVDSITAFSPPRLPESVSAKKKHRMARWQHNPAVMDVDLQIYHKTVQKQREALKHAEIEFQRVQVIDNHLRRHFLQHIKGLNEEMALISKDLGAEQLKCVKATEWYLPTSRSRGRNDEKTGMKAMKDMFHGLRRLDVELQSKREVLQLSSKDKLEQTAGVGGVSGDSFMEWRRSTDFKTSKLAAAWVVQNDNVVISSFGGVRGAVIHFFPYSPLDPTAEPPHDVFPKKKMPIDYSFGSGFSGARRNSPFGSKSSPPKKKIKAAAAAQDDQSAFGKMVAPRFAVRLPFGVGFFSVASVVSTEDPSTYTNEKLAERWKRLIETASSVAPTLDIETMFNKTADEVNAAVREYERSARGEEAREQPRTEDHLVKNMDDRRVVPLGSDMLPTAGARGALLEKASLAELNHCGSKLFYGAKGVLGNPENVGVTTEVRELEDQNQEYLNMQAKVLQLRNQLYRQRRIRYLNEKTYNSTKERASKVESLVTEMRTDLKILKARLDEEIRELGLSEETAERILSSYYSSLDVSENQSSRRRSLPPSDVEEVVEEVLE